MTKTQCNFGSLQIMLPKQRKAFMCAHIIFTFAFVVHLSIIAYDLKYPKYPSIRIRKTELRNIDFPLVFKFCIKDGKNKNIFQKLGYKGRYEAFVGSSMFNRSLFGWNGHTEDFSTLMPVRGKNCQIAQVC